MLTATHPQNPSNLALVGMIMETTGPRTLPPRFRLAEVQQFLQQTMGRSFREACCVGLCLRDDRRMIERLRIQDINGMRFRHSKFGCLYTQVGGPLAARAPSKSSGDHSKDRFHLGGDNMWIYPTTATNLRVYKWLHR